MSFTTEERAKSLHEIAKYIRDNGWCQNIGENEGGNVCSIRAMYKVTKGIWNNEGSKCLYHCLLDDMYAFLGEKVIKPLTPNIPSLAYWNDKPERTKEEVIQAFDNCAKYVENA